MAKFSIRPALTFRGRTFKGLRGWSGKPLHPPLTDVPVTAYLLAAGFDVGSRLLRDRGTPISRELFVAGTLTMAIGFVVSLAAILTGWADWHRSSQPGTQARRTINTHGGMMITATLIVITDLAYRWFAYRDYGAAPWRIALLSVVAAAFVSVGSTYGGSVVYDYGFNVETAGDHPVWHVSDTDVFPGEKH